jgi:hypothetical protein
MAASVISAPSPGTQGQVLQRRWPLSHGYAHRSCAFLRARSSTLSRGRLVREGAPLLDQVSQPEPESTRWASVVQITPRMSSGSPRASRGSTRGSTIAGGSGGHVVPGRRRTPPAPAPVYVYAPAPPKPCDCILILIPWIGPDPGGAGVLPFDGPCNETARRSRRAVPQRPRASWNRLRSRMIWSCCGRDAKFMAV